MNHIYILYNDTCVYESSPVSICAFDNEDWAKAAKDCAEQEYTKAKQLYDKYMHTMDNCGLEDEKYNDFEAKEFKKLLKKVKKISTVNDISYYMSEYSIEEIFYYIRKCPFIESDKNENKNT